MLEKSYGKISRWFNRNGSILLTGGAIICTVAAVVCSYKAGKRSQSRPDMSATDKAKNLAATAVFTTGAIACSVISEAKNAQTISLLTAAYFSSEKNRNEMVKNFKNFVGEDKFNEYKKNLRPTPVIPDDIPEGLELFIDEKTGFKSYDTLENKMKQANDFRRYYFDNGGIASHGDWIRFAHFDENDRAWPASDDDYGQPCDKGTTIDDVGYNSYILTESGYESGWIDVEFIKCTNPTTGQAYYLVDIPTPASVMFGEF